VALGAKITVSELSSFLKPMMRSPLTTRLKGVRSVISQYAVGSRMRSSATENQERRTTSTDEEEFPVLTFVNKPEERKWTKREKFPVPPPRYKKMSTTADWSTIWPVARTFHPASVPLPLHQGLVPPKRAIPNKYGNLELMKIPNFLHLTPPAIQRHCEALKRFCTPWPEDLQTEEEVDAHFPMQVTTSDYCHSSPTIRDKRSRIVTLKFKLSTLGLDEHARDKFRRLVLDRYDPSTDMVTLVTDCCPLRKQNFDYAVYLLTALYHESWNRESWEELKDEEDMEKYVWDASKSKQQVAQWLKARLSLLDETMPEYTKSLKEDSLENVSAIPVVKEIANATTELMNEGETQGTVDQYEHAVRKLMGLPPMSLASAQIRIES